MQSYSMNDLLSFFNFAFWAIYESCLRTHGVVFWSPGKTSAGFWNFSWSLINGNDITCDDFLFLDGFDHFLSQVVNGLHFSGFESNFSSLWSRSFDKKNNYLRIFQFKFLQLLPPQFHFLPWFLHRWIFWRLEWGLQFYSFRGRKFTNRPTLWMVRLNPNFWPWPWRWRFYQYRAVLQWARLYRRFCLI